MYSILVNSRFLYNRIIYNYVKAGTGKFAVANTVVVYAIWILARYDIVRLRTMSYVHPTTSYGRRTMSGSTSHVRYRTYDITYDIVRTTSYVCPHRRCDIRHRMSDIRHRTSKYCSCQSYVRCRIRCRIRHRMFFGRHRTYNVRYRQKTYDVVRFYPFLAILTYDIVYDIVRFLTMSHTMCKTTSVLYDLVRQVPMSLAHIAINIRYMATTSYAISQHTICHT